MPARGSYGSMGVGDQVASILKRPAARRVSYDQTNVKPWSGTGTGKFGGLPGGPSGGAMNTGGKRRPTKARDARID